VLIKRTEREARRGSLTAAFADKSGGFDRRTFLKRSGLAAGGLAALGSLQLGSVQRAEAGSPVAAGAKITTTKAICTHCSVGCTVIAEVSNGVWIGQEPGWDSPINRGSHCAKGAAVRELVHGDRRLKYPMKLEGGQWKRVSWETAINEIGDKLQKIRATNGSDSVYWLGSAKSSNEGAYLNRKLAAYWGTNNVDHQARICHSTTVAGVANTWGYGAMTNSYNDIREAKTVVIMGGNPAEAHPVSLQHLLEGKEEKKQNFIVIEPRLTRTAAHANEFVRIRSGTDIPIIWGLLHHIFANGWEDKQFIQQRVYGMDEVRKECAKWTPEEVERVTGVPGEQLKRVAEKFAKERPATLVWCMGATQHTVGTANVRAFCTLLLATGNAGQGVGNGANIFRGHCNVQGATDLGLDIVTLPLYYGLVEGAWRHWSRVWETDFAWLQGQFTDPKMMNVAGIPSTRWYEATLAPKEQVAQKDNLKAMMIFGHGGNTVTRIPKAAEGVEKLELLVVADPHPTSWVTMGNRKDNTYLLPIATQFECSGSRTASNRSIQWYDAVVKPIFESKDDLEVLYLLAKKLGFEDKMFKNIKVTNNLPLAEDVLREINRGGFSTGYCGQSPERLKAHMANQDKFHLVTLRAEKNVPEVGGDFYGLPWPCWGTPDLKHPGTHRLYNITTHVMEGGGTFRARFGVERVIKTKVMEDGKEVEKEEKHNLLAEGVASVGSDLKDGYPEFNYGVLKKLGWDKDLTDAERATIERIGGGPEKSDGVSWATDLSGGIQRVCLQVHGVMHYGNAKARVVAFGLPDALPVHREPIYTPRPDLVAKYPTLPDVKAQFRVPNIGFSIQKEAVDKGIAKQFPLINTSGRLVEYEGGGEETRSNKWLAELQQDSFIEINPADASDRGIKDGQWVWVTGAEGAKAKVKALVTERVGKGTTWMPFHFAGWFQGVDERNKYPKGTDPIVLGESVNTITTYGYDPVTGMQEPKSTLCQVAAA